MGDFAAAGTAVLCPYITPGSHDCASAVVDRGSARSRAKQSKGSENSEQSRPGCRLLFGFVLVAVDALDGQLDLTAAMALAGDERPGRVGHDPSAGGHNLATDKSPLSIINYVELI